MKSEVFRSVLLFAAIAFATGPALQAAAETTASTAKFSDPSKPGSVKLQIGRGNIRVIGTDAADVTVKSDARPVESSPRKDGLRVLSTSSGFTLTEKNNVITLESGGDGFGSQSDFEIAMPRQASLVIENSWGGKVLVRGIAGDIEISALNGEVALEEIGGGAVVQTMNGEITASVAKLGENRPLSFTSMNGPVLIRLPGDSKANVRLRTHNGAILTDFEEGALVTKVENTAGFGSRGAWRSGGTSPRAAVLPPEAHEAIREASRVAVEATRQAAQAFREAADAAREGADSARVPEARHAPRPPTPPIPPMSGGKLVTGTLNGGGSEINVTTMNGDVTLRKLNPQR